MKLFKYRHLSIAVVALACWPVLASGQSGSVVLRGSVSEMVALSVSPDLPARDAQVITTNDRRSLTFELTGSGSDSRTFRVPILIRSNSSYWITSLVRSEAVYSAKLVPLEARPTGPFVTLEAATSMIAANPAGALAAETPLSLLRGSRVSLAGTLDSPGNALEVTLLLTVIPETKSSSWYLQLTLSSSPAE